MTDRLSISTFTIEVDGRPTLAFKARKYAEAEAICEDEALRTRLRLLNSGEIPVCGDRATLVVRLSHTDEAVRYRQAASASSSTEDVMLVYLVAVDGAEDR
jgi:hypothetical protein